MQLKGNSFYPVICNIVLNHRPAVSLLFPGGVICDIVAAQKKKKRYFLLITFFFLSFKNMIQNVTVHFSVHNYISTAQILLYFIRVYFESSLESFQFWILLNP